MNDENNQKDEGAEDIPYFKCNKCKYLKRADIFFGEALKEYDGEKCPRRVKILLFFKSLPTFFC